MHCAMMQHMTAVGHRHVCPTLTNTSLVNPEPSDASTDRQGSLGIDPRAGTDFILGPLSDRILISGGPCGKWSEYTVQKTEDIYQVTVLLTDRE